MTGMLGRFLDLPPAARAALMVVGGGSVLGAAMMVLPGVPVYVPLILIGVALAGLCVLGFLAVLRWRDRRKSGSFDRGLRSGGGGAPVSSAGARAKLDDLRRQFEKGVETFREHGKDLYALPWYLLVGEPGSGKTEAIRHCNVGFPPGLHDPLQGTGGTVNMNWWFTNKAVILDTAGRLMFEEVEAGKTSEWKEFLKLLRTARGSCPVNGMLLVIPADSLIRDTADEIQTKGGRIAEQLDQIQRTLGVRFPVFVVITKSDLIGGFREFFRDMDDPQLSQQILGWSNPGALDDPFKPEQVESHLSAVAERLRRRRMGLLVDPVHREDALAGRRTDEVDGLFGFPDNLLKIGSRLRMYLEMVFVQGEWSTKPLFLRGIYFTSSMQEGAELDAELAEAMGVDVQDLPGTGWERSTSYFLRDLFLSKVFRERGLVTRSTNARRHQRRARAIVYGSSLAAVLGLIAVTVLTAGGLERAVGRESAFWGDVRRFFAQGERGSGAADARIVTNLNGRWTYWGDRQIDASKWTFDGERALVADLPAMTHERASAEAPRAPLIYRPVAGLARGVFSKRPEAHAAVVRELVLEPAVEASRARLVETAGDGSSWTSDEAERAAAAMELLITIERDAGRAGELDASTLIEHATDGLSGVTGEGRDEIEAQLAALDEAVGWAFHAEGGSQPIPSSLRFVPGESDDPLIAGTKALGLHWQAIGTGRAGVLGQIEELRAALDGYVAAQKKLDGIEFDRVETLEQYEDAVARWDEAYELLRASQQDLAGAIEPLVQVIDAAPGPGTVVDVLRRAAEDEREREISDRAQALLGRIGEPDTDTRLDRIKQALVEARDEAVRAADQKRDRLLAGLDGERQALVMQVDDAADGPGVRAHEARWRIYSWADHLIAATDGEAGDGAAGEAWEVPGTVREIADALVTLEQRTDAIPSGQGSEWGTDGPIETASRVRRAVVARRAQLLVGRVLQAVLENEGGLEALVRRETESDSAIDALPTGLEIPASVGLDPETDGAYAQGLDESFNPAGAEQVLGALARIDDAIRAGSGGPGDSSSPLLDADSLRDRWRGVSRDRERYLARYRKYWGEELAKAIAFDRSRFRNWDAMRTTLERLHGQRSSINSTLLALAESSRDALDRFAVDSVASGAGWQSRVIGSLGVSSGGGTRYESRLGEVLTNWLYLGSPPTVANVRDEVLATEAKSFERDFLEGVYDQTDPSVPYWSELVMGTLASLASSSVQLVSEDVAQVRSLGRRFPVSKDAARDSALTRDEVDELWTLVRSLGGASEASGAGGANGSGGRIADGEELRQSGREVNELVDRLRGGGVIGDEQRRFLRERVLTVLEFLRGGEERARWLEWELHLLASGEGNPGAFTVRRFRMERADGQVLSVGHDMERGIDTDSPSDQSFGRFGVYAAPGDLVLSGTKDTQGAAGWRTWEMGRWTVLDGLLGGLAQLEVGTGLWRVPTGLDRASDEFLEPFWIRVRFGEMRGNSFDTREVPSLVDWPRVGAAGWGG